MIRPIDANAMLAPLKEEYKKVKQAFDETSVFQAPNDVALYGALMQEVGAVIGMIEDAKTIDAIPISFIEEQVKLCNEIGFSRGEECFTALIEKWREKNGTETD